MVAAPVVAGGSKREPVDSPGGWNTKTASCTAGLDRDHLVGQEGVDDRMNGEDMNEAGVDRLDRWMGRTDRQSKTRGNDERVRRKMRQTNSGRRERTRQVDEVSRRDPRGEQMRWAR